MNFQKSIIAAILLFGLIWISCSDEDKSTNGGDSGGLPVEVTIGPDGGIVTVPGQLTLQVIAGALDEDVTFTVDENKSPDSPGGSMGFVSPVFSIEPTGTAFNPPYALLSIHYNENLLGGGSEGAVEIYTDSAGTGWKSITTFADTMDNMVLATTRHLTDFAAVVDTSQPAAGVYAVLVVGRTIAYMVVPYRVDMLTARFDSAYAPCESVDPLQAGEVTCDEFTLSWGAITKMYTYTGQPEEFIYTGSTYVFEVTANAYVPALTAGITFPEFDPYVTSPAMYASVSKAGFDVSWEGGGGGTVELILLRNETDSVLMVTTDNDGAYSFPATQLSSLSTGQYTLILNHYNREFISSPGYDPRSIVAARVINPTIINLTE
jgi:hypothetical protein